MVTLGPPSPNHFSHTPLPPLPPPHTQGADAESVLVDLSSRHLCAPSPMQGGPPSVQNDVKRYDQAISMVLRHFWSCFNPRPPRGDEALADKAKRMADSLQRYKETKIKDLASRLPPENRPVGCCGPFLLSSLPPPPPAPTQPRDPLDARSPCQAHRPRARPPRRVGGQAANQEAQAAHQEHSHKRQRCCHARRRSSSGGGINNSNSKRHGRAKNNDCGLIHEIYFC